MPCAKIGSSRSFARQCSKMSGVEDISDDNNEDVNELSDEHQLPMDKHNKPILIVDSNYVETGSAPPTDSAPLTDSTDATVEDVVDTEDCNKDDGADSSKAGNSEGNPDSTLKVISMCT